MQEALRGAVACVLALAAVLMAAKAHGRQVRLRREAEGVREVDFRGPNPAAAERIWRRDRIGYWSAFAAAAAGGLGVRLWGAYDPSPAWAFWPVALGAAFVVPFLAMAAYWWADLRRLPAVQGEPPAPSQVAPQEPPGWPWSVGAALLLAGAIAVPLA